MHDYCQRIRRMRISLELSQSDLATKLGITLSGYSKIERGKTDLTVNRLLEIAAALNVSPGIFFTDEIQNKVEEQENPYASLKEIEAKLSVILSKLPQ